WRWVVICMRSLKKTTEFATMFMRFSPSSLRVFPVVSLLILTSCSHELLATKDEITPESLVEKAGLDMSFEGVNASIVKSAKKASDEGDHRRASQFYKQLINESKGEEADIYQLAYAESLRRAGDYGLALNT